MEQIKFEIMDYVVKFLEKEGQVGNDIKDVIINDYNGSLIENMKKSQTLKQVNTNPIIYYLRIRYQGIFFRFFGPKKNSTIYLLHAIKKKKNQIEPHEINTALDRASRLISLL